jgi:hypothetical protein
LEFLENLHKIPLEFLELLWNSWNSFGISARWEISIISSSSIDNLLKIGCLPPHKSKDFLFFPKSTLEKLLKSKILEFLGHSLILNSILKFPMKGKEIKKKSSPSPSLHRKCLEREFLWKFSTYHQLQTLKLNLKLTSDSKALKFWIWEAFFKNFQGKI